MKKITLMELALPLIKSIDSFNFLLKSHHRRVAVAAFYIGKKMNLNQTDLLNLVIAASLHDIGALSVVERDTLIQADVDNPEPHCIMGYKMLSTFEVFKDIATIIKSHHIKNSDYLNHNNDVPLASLIIHLADRVDIYTSPNEFVLMQKNRITEEIRSRTGAIFNPDVFQAFEEVSKADIFWIDMNNMTLEQLFQKLNFTFDIELSLELLQEFAYTLSKIVDFRSHFTVAHSHTVAQLSFFLGNLFKCDTEMCSKLKIAGYLHDLGKIGIDPGLIDKSTKLTELEYQMIKLHPYYTEQILIELQQSEWFSEIIEWASNHHEKTNGSGYPHAYTEENFSFGSKILAFADIISALLDERPYHSRYSIEEAFKIIDEQIAYKISVEMFETIKMHSKEIESLVVKSFDESSKDYLRQA